MGDFNLFVNEAGVVDIPMGGFSFTRGSSIRAKSSRLDRFLLSHETLDKFSDLQMCALDLLIFFITSLSGYLLCH